MYSDKIDDWVEDTGLILQHRISPVLMLKAMEGIGPVCGKAYRPEGYGYDKQNTEGGQLTAYRKGDQYHGRLDAPVRIVDRRVTEDHAENKGDDCR